MIFPLGGISEHRKNFGHWILFRACDFDDARVDFLEAPSSGATTGEILCFAKKITHAVARGFGTHLGYSSQCISRRIISMLVSPRSIANLGMSEVLPGNTITGVWWPLQGFGWVGDGFTPHFFVESFNV